MELCEHTKRVGDNYGVSCQDCGIVLEGFGYGGWLGSNPTGREQCFHVWWKVSAGEEECPYCHATRERAHHAH
jgi:hypothetical protein